MVSSFLDADPTRALSRVNSLRADPQTGPVLALAAYAEALTVILYVLTVVFLLRGGAKGDVGIQLLLWTTIVLVVLPGAVGQARFRIPIEPLLAILAAGGAMSLNRRSMRAEKDPLDRDHSWRPFPCIDHPSVHGNALWTASPHEPECAGGRMRGGCKRVW